MQNLSSLTRDQTCIPCIARQVLTHWTIREAPQWCLFAEIEKLILRLVWHFKGPGTALLKRNKLGGLILPDIETYSKATVIKTVWYCHKYSPMEQNREPRGQTHVYSQLIFDFILKIKKKKFFFFKIWLCGKSCEILVL